MASEKMTKDNLGEGFAQLIAGEAAAVGKQISANLDEVRAYAAERMLHLSTIVGERGYEEALVAERDSVLLRLGIAAVNSADAADQRIIGAVAGALALSARILAAA